MHNCYIDFKIIYRYRFKAPEIKKRKTIDCSSHVCIEHPSKHFDFDTKAFLLLIQLLDRHKPAFTPWNSAQAYTSHQFCLHRNKTLRTATARSSEARIFHFTLLFFRIEREFSKTNFIFLPTHDKKAHKDTNFALLLLAA